MVYSLHVKPGIDLEHKGIYFGREITQANDICPIGLFSKGREYSLASVVPYIIPSSGVSMLNYAMLNTPWLEFAKSDPDEAVWDILENVFTDLYALPISVFGCDGFVDLNIQEAADAFAERYVSQQYSDTGLVEAILSSLDFGSAMYIRNRFPVIIINEGVDDSAYHVGIEKIMEIYPGRRFIEVSLTGPGG